MEAYVYQGDGAVLAVDRTQSGLPLTKTLDDVGFGDEKRLYEVFRWELGINPLATIANGQS